MILRSNISFLLFWFCLAINYRVSISVTVGTKDDYSTYIDLLDGIDCKALVFNNTDVMKEYFEDNLVKIKELNRVHIDQSCAYSIMEQILSSTALTANDIFVQTVIRFIATVDKEYPLLKGLLQKEFTYDHWTSLNDAPFQLLTFLNYASEKCLINIKLTDLLILSVHYKNNDHHNQFEDLKSRLNSLKLTHKLGDSYEFDPDLKDETAHPFIHLLVSSSYMEPVIGSVEYDQNIFLKNIGLFTHKLPYKTFKKFPLDLQMRIFFSVDLLEDDFFETMTLNEMCPILNSLTLTNVTLLDRLIEPFKYGTILTTPPANFKFGPIDGTILNSCFSQEILHDFNSTYLIQTFKDTIEKNGVALLNNDNLPLVDYIGLYVDSLKGNLTSISPMKVKLLIDKQIGGGTCPTRWKPTPAVGTTTLLFSGRTSALYADEYSFYVNTVYEPDMHPPLDRSVYNWTLPEYSLLLSFNRTFAFSHLSFLSHSLFNDPSIILNRLSNLTSQECKDLTLRVFEDHRQFSLAFAEKNLLHHPYGSSCLESLITNSLDIIKRDPSKNEAKANLQILTDLINLNYDPLITSELVDFIKLKLPEHSNTTFRNQYQGFWTALFFTNSTAVFDYFTLPMWGGVSNIVMKNEPAYTKFLDIMNAFSRTPSKFLGRNVISLQDRPNWVNLNFELDNLNNLTSKPHFQRDIFLNRGMVIIQLLLSLVSEVVYEDFLTLPTIPEYSLSYFLTLGPANPTVYTKFNKTDWEKFESITVFEAGHVLALKELEKDLDLHSVKVSSDAPAGLKVNPALIMDSYDRLCNVLTPPSRTDCPIFKQFTDIMIRLVQ